MERPFEHGDLVFYYVSKGKRDKPKRYDGIILDSFYQHKTSTRREGWRLLIDFENKLEPMEKNLDEVHLELFK